MPYKQITQLPDSVKNNLPKHAQGSAKKHLTGRGAVRRGEPRPPCRLECRGAEVREERQRQLGPEVAPEHVGAVREPPSMRTEARRQQVSYRVRVNGTPPRTGYVFCYSWIPASVGMTGTGTPLAPQPDRGPFQTPG
jgi:hypothetical protein